MSASQGVTSWNPAEEPYRVTVSVRNSYTWTHFASTHKTIEAASAAFDAARGTIVRLQVAENVGTWEANGYFKTLKSLDRRKMRAIHG